jgi:hypothetical protein
MSYHDEKANLQIDQSSARLSNLLGKIRQEYRVMLKYKKRALDSRGSLINAIYK